MDQNSVTILCAVIGAVSGIAGAAGGAWFAFLFQKKLLKEQLAFQRKLLDRQLAFQKESGEQDAALRQKIYDEWGVVFKEFRNMINERSSSLLKKVPEMA